MKVLICSDSHRRLDYFQQVMELENPEIVIFAGDHSTDAIDMSLVYRDVLFAIVKGILIWMIMSPEIREYLT